MALPILDRDEARFARATAQMIEGGDYTAIRFQDRLREGAAPGSTGPRRPAAGRSRRSAEAHKGWAWRLPSLLGMALAAMTCAWGASALFNPKVGVWAGVILGGSFIGPALAAAGHGRRAVHGGQRASALAAFARLYMAARGEKPARGQHKVLFWTGIILAVLGKGR